MARPRRAERPARVRTPHGAPEGARNKITALRCHPRNDDACWNPEACAFLVNDGGAPRRVPGAHALLDQVCPAPQVRARRQREAPPRAWRNYASWAGGRAERGVGGGERVHREVEAWAQHGEEWRRVVPTPHPYTLRLVEWMRRHRIEPIAAEHLIHDAEGLGFATRVDLLVLNRGTGDVEAWELKTGYDGVFLEGTGRARGPLAPYFSNSHLDRARIQAWLARVVLKVCYGVGVVARVVQVTDAGVGSKLLPPDLLRDQDAVYGGLVRWLRGRRFGNEPSARARRRLQRRAGPRRALPAKRN